ncbi:MAG: hypothetical protein N2C14_08080, partial [Planctomycetales bacterium]
QALRKADKNKNPDEAEVKNLKQKIAEIEDRRKQFESETAAWLAKQRRLYIDWFEFEGPYFESWPPKTRTAYLGRPEDHADPSLRARAA